MMFASPTRVVALAMLIPLSGCCHCTSQVAVTRDAFSKEVIRYLEPMDTCDSDARLTLSYRTHPGQPPDTVRLTISAPGAFWQDQVNSSPRLGVVLNGNKYDGGPITTDVGRGDAWSPLTGFLLTEHRTIVTADLSRLAVEKLAQAQSVTLHFINKDLPLSPANIESVRGLVATWQPGYKDPAVKEWKPPSQIQPTEICDGACLGKQKGK